MNATQAFKAVKQHANVRPSGGYAAAATDQKKQKQMLMDAFMRKLTADELAQKKAKNAEEQEAAREKAEAKLANEEEEKALANSSTYAEEGSRTINIVGCEDKRGCTVAFSVKPSGDVKPMQCIFPGSTDLSTPGGQSKKDKEKKKPKAPVRQRADEGGHLMCATANKWQTEDSYKKYIEKIVVPDYKETCRRFNKEIGKQWYILQVDAYSVHISEGVLQWMHDKHPYLKPRFIPAGTTPVAQVLDTFVNRPFKNAIKTKFQAWYVAKAREQIRTGVNDNTLPTTSAVGEMRMLSLEWMLDAWEHIKTMSAQIVEAYKKTGTLAALTDCNVAIEAMPRAGQLFGSVDAAKTQTEPRPADEDPQAKATDDDDDDDDDGDKPDDSAFYTPNPAAAKHEELMKMSRKELISMAAMAELSDAQALAATAGKRKGSKRGGPKQPKKAPVPGRKRGRPAGSKNKATLAKEAAAKEAAAQRGPAAAKECGAAAKGAPRAAKRARTLRQLVAELSDVSEQEDSGSGSGSDSGPGSGSGSDSGLSELE